MSVAETTSPTGSLSTATEPASATALLGIEGMHCASCVSRVEKELRGVPGVVEASVSLPGEEARVTFTPLAADVAQLERAVERAGLAARVREGERARAGGTREAPGSAPA